jgi:endonuclease/exonuclease/phosphatase family metal-dependent hydrolase
MKYLFILLSLSIQLYGTVEQSIAPFIDTIYSNDYRIININQKEWLQCAAQNQHKKVRVMTFNMLYNEMIAEAKLPLKHQWPFRKTRLLEYLDYINADIIGSQELQEDQVQDIITAIGDNYSYYGLKTRENEGRSDTNAVFFKHDRFELLDAKTIPYGEIGGNAFTYCYFKDKLLDQTFIVMNTKLSWGISWTAMKKRMSEAIQLNQFALCLPEDEPIILTGDFNTLPFIDGKSIVDTITENNLKDAKTTSIFGHFGPYCSITNSFWFFTPFTGPELKGFILDRIFVNKHIKVFVHSIDTAKVNGEFASDHFPVIADILFK